MFDFGFDILFIRDLVIVAIGLMFEFGLGFYVGFVFGFFLISVLFFD